jgi:hypothetical protein
MMNLIPPAAKRILRIDYIIRVCASYALLFSSALVLIVIMFIPVYVFITIQINNVSGLVSGMQSHELISTEVLVVANQQATLLTNEALEYNISDIVDVLNKSGVQGIFMSDIRLQQQTVPTVTVSGQASTRSALVAFRDSIEMSLKPVTLDLPISNLVKETDLQFSLSLTLATSTI